MSPRILVIIALVAALAFVSTLTAAEKYSSVRIAIDDKSDLQKVWQLGLDVVEQGPDYLDAVVPADQIALIRDAGLKHTIRIDDMTAYFQSRLDATRHMGGYRTLSDIGLVLDSIASEHPNIVAPRSRIGMSIQGRDIWLLKISDNPTVDEGEPEVYYYACHHAREVITPEVLIYFMRYLTNNYGTDPQVTYLVDNREMFFAPCVNPDGYYHNEVENPSGGGMWRKNRRNNGDGSYGVDINRNYGYMWGYDNSGSSPTPSSETYRGTGPFSEPEIVAQRLFLNSRQIRVIVNYHSFSNLFLYPWGYVNSFTPDHDVFDAMGDSVHAMNGYTPGTPMSTLGYLVNGGAFDWEYGEQTSKPKIYAISVEVGSSSDNFWPPTYRITPLVQENLQPNLFYARIAGNPEVVRAPASPTIHVIGDVDTSFFNLYWHHFDLGNPAVSFEVWQLQNMTRITDDLESGLLYWSLNGFVSSAARYHSSGHSLNGGGGNNIDHRATMSCPIHVGAGDSLKFWTWHQIEDGWDYGYVEVSTNGGVSWSSIPGNITTTTNPHQLNLGNGITGTRSVWSLAQFSLAGFVGQDILVRFRYVTDSYTSYEGWYVDDVYPVDYYGTSELIAAAVTDTTLPVENLAIGDYFYRVRARDAENQLSAFSAVEPAHVFYNTNAGCSWLVGDANNDAAYDISDAVNLVAYIFSGGAAPLPNPVGSGDADCSGNVDVSDAVYLVAYIFTSGPTPAPTCDCSDY